MGSVGAVALAILIWALARHADRPAPASTELAPLAVPASPEPRVADTKQASPLPRTVASSHAGVQPNAPQLDEASILARLHDLGATDPPLSLKLAKEALDRFPDSHNAPEFEWNVVKALFNMQRLEEAKDEARVMLFKYPDNYFTNDVEHHLLNHPPNPPGTPNPP